MPSQLPSHTCPPAGLDHALAPHFEALARLESSRQLEASPLYRRLRPQVEALMRNVAVENLAPAPVPARRVRALAWNIERGTRQHEITRLLGEHPLLSRADVLLLTELDYGMARSGNRFVAREMAEALELNYAFAPCYVALNKGSGLESQVAGENRQALHGNALFSRFPMREIHSLALPNGKDKMRGKEKRLGCQKAVIAVIEHTLGPLRVACVHLDAHSTQRHRHRQMKILLDHLERLDPLPTLIGGDWNTSTHNSKRALYSILGYCRRVLMGVHHVLEHHYPHPDRWFERHLFRELERRGYHYRDLNEPGGSTLHYHIRDLAANHRMADWIPHWCFWFINWALRRAGETCSMKLDWFAGRGIRALSDSPSGVVRDLHPEGHLLSDHDPILLDFELAG